MDFPRWSREQSPTIRERKEFNFPDWYEFSNGRNVKVSENNRLDKQYKQIGNAVPVFLARAVAKPIASWAIQYIVNQKVRDTQMKLFI